MQAKLRMGIAAQVLLFLLLCPPADMKIVLHVGTMPWGVSAGCHLCRGVSPGQPLTLLSPRKRQEGKLQPVPSGQHHLPLPRGGESCGILLCF